VTLRQLGAVYNIAHDNQGCHVAGQLANQGCQSAHQKRSV
jgi:metal-sulfur cluster biosynthetic enzyme